MIKQKPEIQQNPTEHLTIVIELYLSFLFLVIFVKAQL